MGKSGISKILCDGYTDDIIKGLLPEQLTPGTRLLLVNAGLGGNVYDLLNRYPGLEVQGLTGNRLGEQLTRSNIHMTYVGPAEGSMSEAPLDIAAVRQAIDGQVYHEIVLLGDYRKIPDSEELLTILKQHIISGGHMRYGDDTAVHERLVVYADAAAASLSMETQQAYQHAMSTYDVYSAANIIMNNMLKLLLTPADNACGIISGGYQALAFVGISELYQGRPLAALAYMGEWMRLVRRFRMSLFYDVLKYMGVAYACLGKFDTARALFQHSGVDDETICYQTAINEAEKKGYHSLDLLPREPLRLPHGVGWRDIPIFINSRDRVTYLRRLVEWLLRAGYRCIYILDNASTYPPLLDYYASIAKHPNVRVIYLPNLGHTAIWLSGILDKLQIKTVYAYTDSDVLPVDDCPEDVLLRLFRLLQRYPMVEKAGLGIEYSDITFWDKENVQAEHQNFYKVPLEKNVYFAPVDTTFALYRPIRHYSLFYAVRTTGRLWLRHLPWYLDRDNLPEEERYYMEHANKSSTQAKTFQKLSKDD